VLQFLSAGWLSALDGVLRADGGLGPRFATSPVAIGQEVADTGDGGEPIVVRYVVVLDGAGGRVASDAPADVTFACDRTTAAELAQGVLNAQRALTSGRLKIKGEVDRLVAASGALAALGDLLAGLRADTEF
jgi:SCP-2 sterol transfer family